MANKVVYVSSDVTLHQVLGSEEVNGNTVYNVDSVTLGVGDTFDFDKLPPYQQEAVESGKVPGAEVVSESEGKKLSEARAAFLESIGQGSSDVSYVGKQLTGPDANDGSHSDHEVSDEERAANHAARAEAETGETDAPEADEVDETETDETDTTDPDAEPVKENKSKPKSDK